MTAAVDRHEPSPEKLQAAAEAEADACEVEGGGYWSKRACRESRRLWGGSPRVRRCRRPGCPHHVHAFARADACYCSGTCRMTVLRARRKEKK